MTAEPFAQAIVPAVGLRGGVRGVGFGDGVGEVGGGGVHPQVRLVWKKTRTRILKNLVEESLPGGMSGVSRS